MIMSQELVSEIKELKVDLAKLIDLLGMMLQLTMEEQLDDDRSLSDLYAPLTGTN